MTCVRKPVRCLVLDTSGTPLPNQNGAFGGEGGEQISCENMPAAPLSVGQRCAPGCSLNLFHTFNPKMDGRTPCLVLGDYRVYLCKGETNFFRHPAIYPPLSLCAVASFSPRTYIRGPAANQRAKSSDRRGVRGGAQLGARATDAGGSDAFTWLVFFFDPSSFFCPSLPDVAGLHHTPVKVRVGFCVPLALVQGAPWVMVRVSTCCGPKLPVCCMFETIEWRVANTVSLTGTIVAEGEPLLPYCRVPVNRYLCMSVSCYDSSPEKKKPAVCFTYRTSTTVPCAFPHVSCVFV